MGDILDRLELSSPGVCDRATSDVVGAESRRGDTAGGSALPEDMRKRGMLRALIILVQVLFVDAADGLAGGGCFSGGEGVIDRRHTSGNGRGKRSSLRGRTLK